jgi:hypothetical protein
MTQWHLLLPLMRLACAPSTSDSHALLHVPAQVEPREAEVEPDGLLEVVVRVQMDEARLFKDVLHVLVTDGADISIPLLATGGSKAG